MNVLGFDTSTRLCSVGVVKEGHPAALEIQDSGESHSVHLMPMIERALVESGIEKNKLDLVAAGNGPGSFTGIRIAVTTAKTLAFALGKPCVAVNTLDAMMRCMEPGYQSVCPVIDARKNEVYWKLWEWRNDVYVPLTDSMLTPVGSLLERCPGGTLFCGNGTLVYGKQMEQQYGDTLQTGSASTMHLLGQRIADMGWELLTRGEIPDPFTIVPRYIRKPEAEVQWEKKHGKKTERS